MKSQQPDLAGLAAAAFVLRRRRIHGAGLRRKTLVGRDRRCVDSPRRNSAPSIRRKRSASRGKAISSSGCKRRRRDRSPSRSGTRSPRWSRKTTCRRSTSKCSSISIPPRSRQEALPILKQLGAALSDEKLKGSVFLVAGHTDAKGSDAYNLSLSDATRQIGAGLSHRDFQASTRSNSSPSALARSS